MKPASVNIAKLKAQLSRYLRSVRRGEEVIVTDRERRIAKVVPYQEPHAMKLEIRRAEDPSSLSRLKFPPIKGAAVDSLSVLLEDRRKGR